MSAFYLKHWKEWDEKHSPGPCLHGPYSLEKKKNTKVVDKVEFTRCYGSSRSGKVIEGSNRSGKAIYRKWHRKLTVLFL